jgi:carbon monoxide dehydrogenase subunit G
MENIESKQGKIIASIDSTFEFLSDIRNLDSYIPSDKVQNWTSTEDSCSFSISQVGEVNLRVTKKEAPTLIKIEPEGKSPIDFAFFIQLMEVSETECRIKLTFRADLNPMMKMMIKKPLQKGLDQVIDTICGMEGNFNPQ